MISRMMSIVSRRSETTSVFTRTCVQSYALREREEGTWYTSSMSFFKAFWIWELNCDVRVVSLNWNTYTFTAKERTTSSTTIFRIKMLFRQRLSLSRAEVTRSWTKLVQFWGHSFLKISTSIMSHLWSRSSLFWIDSIELEYYVVNGVNPVLRTSPLRECSS